MGKKLAQGRGKWRAESERHLCQRWSLKQTLTLTQALSIGGLSYSLRPLPSHMFQQNECGATRTAVKGPVYCSKRLNTTVNSLEGYRKKSSTLVNDKPQSVDHRLPLEELGNVDLPHLMNRLPGLCDKTSLIFFGGGFFCFCYLQSFLSICFFFLSNSGSQVAAIARGRVNLGQVASVLQG